LGGGGERHITIAFGKAACLILQNLQVLFVHTGPRKGAESAVICLNKGRRNPKTCEQISAEQAEAKECYDESGGERFAGARWRAGKTGAQSFCRTDKVLICRLRIDQRYANDNFRKPIGDFI